MCLFSFSFVRIGFDLDVSNQVAPHTCDFMEHCVDNFCSDYCMNNTKFELPLYMRNLCLGEIEIPS